MQWREVRPVCEVRRRARQACERLVLPGVVSPGVLVTNAHLVAGVGELTVTDSAGRHTATTVLFDPDEDLAVLTAPTLQAAALATDPTDLPQGRPAPSWATPVVGRCARTTPLSWNARPRSARTSTARGTLSWT